MVIPSRRQRPVNSPGFTLIEVLVAMVLIAIVASNIAALCTLAMRAVIGARRQTSAATLALQKMEQLMALTWATSGGPPGVSVSDLTSDISVDPASASGTGLSPSPTNSLDNNVAGFVDYLDVSGAWVGSGASPPASAVFVRRWRIDPLASDPDNTLVLQVFVTTVEASSRSNQGRRIRQPGDAFLVDVKTRTAQ